MNDRHCETCGERFTPKQRRSRFCSHRCYKASKGDPCTDCGTRTGFGAEQARVAEPRCPSCAIEHNRRWTPDTITARIREWAALHGEPPAVPDWNPWTARHELNDSERAERYEAANGYWPGFTSVIDVFGSWNEAIAAAGFSPRPRYGVSENAARRRSSRARVAA